MRHQARAHSHDPRAHPSCRPQIRHARAGSAELSGARHVSKKAARTRDAERRTALRRTKAAHPCARYGARCRGRRQLRVTAAPADTPPCFFANQRCSALCSVCTDGRQSRKRACAPALCFALLTRLHRQAHSFWGHSAALDLQELAAAARRARAAADAAEDRASPGAASGGAAPAEFTCLQASARRLRHSEAASLTSARALFQVAPGDCRHTALLLCRAGRRATGRVRAYVHEVRAATPNALYACVDCVLRPVASSATWRAWRGTCCC